MYVDSISRQVRDAREYIAAGTTYLCNPLLGLSTLSPSVALLSAI